MKTIATGIPILPTVAQPGGSGAHKSALRLGAHAVAHALRFGDIVAQRLEAGAIAAAFPGGGLEAQLAHRVVAHLTTALAKDAGDRISAQGRSTLQRALAGALAPPGSPPKDRGPDPAASLAQRVHKLLERLTSEPRKPENSGQQKRISGPVLDAKSAKELPAQQRPPAPAQNVRAAAVDAFTRSLLHAASSPTATAPAVPDVLSRMLARAATALAQQSDTKQQQPVASRTAQTAAAHAKPGGATATADPHAAFAKLTAAIVAGAQPHGSDPHAGNDQLPQRSAHDEPSAPAAAPAPARTDIPAFTVPSTQPSAFAAAAAPMHVAAHTVVDPQAVIDQLVRGITMRATSDGSQLRMRLQPEHLGDVNLRLTVSGNTVTANVVAQNADVRDMLMANAHHLARSLAESGLSLGGFSVDVSGGNAGFTQQQTHAQHAAVRLAHHAGTPAFDATDTIPETSAVRPTGPRSLVLNSLA